MDELREFYLETVHSTRRTLATILNIVLRQEETLAMLVRSARDDVLHHNQIPEQQTRSASASATQSSAAGRRRDRSLFERSGTAPIMARTQVQRRRLFNPSRREAPAAAIPGPTAAAGPAPNLFSIPGMAPGAPAAANRREANLGAILAAALMSEMGASLSPVVVRPSARQIEATTEIIPYSDIPENDRIEECPISRETFTETSAVMRIRHCRHYFAPESLRTWFNSSVRCPICRHDIRSTLSENLANDHHVEEDEAEPEPQQEQEQEPQNQDEEVTLSDDDDDDDDDDDGGGNPVNEPRLYSSYTSVNSSTPTVTISSPPTNTTFMNADGTTSFISANPLGDLMNIINNDTQNLNNNTSLTYTIDFTPYLNDISGNIN